MPGHYAFLGVVLFAVLQTAASASGGVAIVEEGQVRAVILVPADCDSQTKAAAETLAHYIERSSGARLPVLVDQSPQVGDARVRIHVGPDRYVQSLALKLDQLDGDGYCIRTTGDGHIAIAGPTPWGTEFGVYEFLERYLGVRWLMPGPEGEDIPSLRTVVVPEEEVRQQPAFFSRQMSGFRGEQGTWARRLRLHDRIKFHHNLGHLFPPKQYTEAHPEFFPVKQGQRFLPAPDKLTSWQPCFSAPGLAEEAIKNICRHFQQHPEDTSYSLGVNDSSGHCECAQCLAKEAGRKNFVGRRHMSDGYYAWCNRVVRGVLEKYPDKWFGCLAYSEVAQPPDQEKLHPRLIPYMTYDRMKWIDPQLRAEGEQVTRAWAEKCSTLGWYDYIYGIHYCVPRVWFHHMADYYRTGSDLGVKAMYAEAYPCWGEGPKLYLALKLQWDPRQDVDKLLREWYARAVGEAAADDLAAYYAHWEDFWTRRILASRWFTKGGQYLAFSTPTYLRDVADEDMAKSRRWMESVVAKAATPQQKVRAGILMLAFEYYEASALAYHGQQSTAESIPANEAEVMTTLDASLRPLLAQQRRLDLLQKEFKKYVALQHTMDFERRPQLRGDDWGGSLPSTLFDWLQKSPAVRKRLAQLADSPGQSIASQARTMLWLAEKPAAVVSQNPSFEEAEKNKPLGWSFWFGEGIGRGEVSSKAAHAGKVGAVCRGAHRGGPTQTIEVSPGRYAATAMVRVPGPISGEARIGLKIVPLDEKNRNLPAISSTLRARPCDWTRIVAAGTLPVAPGGEPMKKARLIILLEGFAAGEEVYLDEVTAYRLVDQPGKSDAKPDQRKR